MEFDLYTPKTIKEIRKITALKRNFLTELFFSNEDTVGTEEVMLEYTKSGEYTAPFITPLESGRPVGDKKTKTNIIKAPSIAPERTLEPKDYFVRDAGMAITGGYNPAQRIGKRITEILTEQEIFITNKEELMVSQFLTTGKVTSATGEAEYEIEYGLENFSTLPSDEEWGKTGVDPFVSLDKIIAKAEETGILVENLVLGTLAAEKLLNSEATKLHLSKDLQSDFVKEVTRKHPGVIWLGTYKTYGVDLFRYSRKIFSPDGKTKIQLMPENQIIGGPKGGTRLYAPVIFMGKGDIHQTKRYSNVVTPTEKTKKITTESRPVLQPCDLDGYFAVTVCQK